MHIFYSPSNSAVARLIYWGGGREGGEAITNAEGVCSPKDFSEPANN